MKKKLLKTTVILQLLLGSIALTSSIAQANTPTTETKVVHPSPLTFEEVTKLISSAHAKAKQLGIAVSVAVYDNSGIIAFQRHPDALLISGPSSKGKAETSLQFNSPTEKLSDLVKPNGIFHTLQDAKLPTPLVFIGGGYPIQRNGKLIGSIGVGGGSVEQDQEIAKYAIKEAGF